MGLLQVAAFLALVNLGLERVDAGRSAILSYTTPIWVAPLAAVTMGERLTQKRLAGLGLGLAGIAVMFNPLSFDWSDHHKLVGNAMLLGAALAWAVTIVHVRSHEFVLSPLQLAPWQMVLGAIPVAVLVALYESPARHPSRSSALWAVLAYNGPFATAFALWAWISVNRALPAITTAMASLAVPVVGLLASTVTLGERLTLANGVGLALIVAGIAAITAGNGARSAALSDTARPLRPSPQDSIFPNAQEIGTRSGRPTVPAA